MPSLPIIPDTGVPSFGVAEVVYHYFVDSHTFWGAGTRLTTRMASLSISQACASITACIDDHGNVSSGTVQVSGGLPSQGIPNGSLLLLGNVLSVVTGGAVVPFSPSFIFKISYSHPWLTYNSPLGVWNASFSIPGWTANDLPNLFRKTWGPASAPLNSYVGQVKCLF